MKRFVTTLIALAAAPCVQAQSLAIVHAKAWTMLSETPVSDATILVSNGRIVSVTPGGATPAGVRIIDAHGQNVTPGLMNAASQLGLMEVSSAKNTRDGAADGGSIGPSFDVSYALNGNSALVDLARADGVTRGLSFPGPSDVAPFSGQATTIRLRDGVDILDRPRAAMFVVIGGGEWDKLGSRAAQWQILRGAFDEVRSAVAGDDKALLNRRDAAAVRQMLLGAMPLAIVTQRESDILQAIRIAADYRIKVVIVGGAEAWRAADALAAAHIAVVLDPEANMPVSFDALGAGQDNAVILSKAGVKVAFGLVGGPITLTYNAGLMLREGAGLAVANGLPYVKALQAITVNPATIWDATKAGTLAPGSDADLVIWDGDPLEVSTNAVAVIVEGKAVSLTTRQSELVARYQSVNVAP